jgi:hypothetical protein
MRCLLFSSYLYSFIEILFSTSNFYYNCGILNLLLTNTTGFFFSRGPISGSFLGLAKLENDREGFCLMKDTLSFGSICVSD